MNAAADIGTAKLIGAIETSLMKEKNDTAIAQVETMTQELRATIPNALPIAPGRKSWISPCCLIPSDRQTSPTVVAHTTSATRIHFVM